MPIRPGTAVAVMWCIMPAKTGSGVPTCWMCLDGFRMERQVKDSEAGKRAGTVEACHPAIFPVRVSDEAPGR